MDENQDDISKRALKAYVPESEVMPEEENEQDES